MVMRFFWVVDQVKHGTYNAEWYPGQENLADYFTKHFDSSHHRRVQPWYLHTNKSPTLLPHAIAPSTLRGCVGTLPNGYHRYAPLPRVNTGVNPRMSQVQDRELGLQTNDGQTNTNNGQTQTDNGQTKHPTIDYLNNRQ